MPEALVREGLWGVIGPLLPAEAPKPKGGRPRVPDRAALEGIVRIGLAGRLRRISFAPGSGSLLPRRPRAGYARPRVARLPPRRTPRRQKEPRLRLGDHELVYQLAASRTVRDVS